MGQACSSKEEDDTLARYNRSDKAGKRRLSTITMQPGQSKDSQPHPASVSLVSRREWLDSESIALSFACLSCAGTYAPDTYKENQDDFLVVEDLDISNSSVAVFGVMDGHGVAGREASSYISAEIKKQLSTDKEVVFSDIKTSLQNIFEETQDGLENSQIDCSCSGSTCVVLCMIGKRLVCANVGDSRCILGYKASDGEFLHKDLSIDHKPVLPEEKKRIESSGGRVEPMKGPYNEPIGPARVWVGNEMYPGLAMSRSIGDSIAQSVGVSCEPEFIEHEVDFSKDLFVILASDGVWEFIESDEAVKIVGGCSNAKEAADALCKESVKRWSEEEEVCDDITAVIIFFEKFKREVPVFERGETP